MSLQRRTPLKRTAWTRTIPTRGPRIDASDVRGGQVDPSGPRGVRNAPRASQLPMRSKKATKAIPERRAAVAAAMARDGRCQGPKHGLGGTCWGPLDGHEVLTRGRGGSPLDPDNILMLCRGHHTVVTDEPELAHRLGLVKHSWEA